MDRRDLLKTSSALGLLSATTLIADEPAADFIYGYAGQLSYEPGDQLKLHVSTSVRRYSVEIARIGGKREVVYQKENLAGARLATPLNAATHGCGWPVSFKLPIAKKWRSGYYSVTMKATVSGGNSIQAEAFFVVRSASRKPRSRILLVLTTNTYNAYNNWGGPCLYESGKLPLQGDRVSFQRPMARGFLTKPKGKLSRWSPYAGWTNWEQPFVQWAEKAGYQIDYAVNSDLERHPQLLKNYRLMLSVGHDEYWSAPMRNQVESFIANGGNVAFFSGNVCYWQVRSEEKGDGMVGYKFNYKQDPCYAKKQYKLLSTLWSNKLVGRPENQLTGVSFNYGGYHRFQSVPRGASGYTIHRPQHWVFEGTKLQWGDLLGSREKIVGYECDGCDYELKDGLPVPTHRDGTPPGFQILALAPARLWDSDLEFASQSLFGDSKHKNRFTHGSATMGIYTRGGTVFTTGCTEWSRGLAGKNPLVQRITRNLLDRLSKRS